MTLAVPVGTPVYAADNGIVTEKQLVGKMIFKIKYLGYPAIWLNISK